MLIFYFLLEFLSDSLLKKQNIFVFLKMFKFSYFIDKLDAIMNIFTGLNYNK